MQRKSKKKTVSNTFALLLFLFPVAVTIANYYDIPRGRQKLCSPVSYSNNDEAFSLIFTVCAMHLFVHTHTFINEVYRILYQFCDRKTAIAVWSRTHESPQRNFRQREKFFLSSWMSFFLFMQCMQWLKNKRGQREVASHIL